MKILSEEKRLKLNNKEWRLNHLYKIIDKTGNLVRFKLNYEQASLFRRYTNTDREFGLREYILKDRQIGITTFHVLYYLDEVIFNRNRTAAIIAHEREALEKIFRKAKIALENLPVYLTPRTTIENKRELTFSDLNSSIYIALKVRSGTINHLHVSEMAYIKEYLELKAGSFSTVPVKGDITCESTGNGLNGFYRDWNDGKTSKLWRNHFFSWTDHIDYSSGINAGNNSYDDYLGDISVGQKNWWYLKLEELGNDISLMKQEYPLNETDAFIHSGRGLFIDEIDSFPISSILRDEEWINIFKEPENDGEYCIGADTSIGYKNGDASCFYVMDNRTWEIMAVWHGRIAPDLYGKEIIKWSEYYNMAFVGIEENNSGVAVINIVKESYSNLYQRERRDTVTEEVTSQLGWYTTQKSKDEIISVIKQTLREKIVGSLPIQLKSELETFVIKENGKKEAISGHYDDHVMAFGICLMMIKSNPYYEIKNKKSTYMGRETSYGKIGG